MFLFFCKQGCKYRAPSGKHLANNYTTKHEKDQNVMKEAIC